MRKKKEEKNTFLSDWDKWVKERERKEEFIDKTIKFSKEESYYIQKSFNLRNDYMLKYIKKCALYLLPDKKFNYKIDYGDLYEEMEKDFRGIDTGYYLMLIERLYKLSYQEFLKTPFWKSISWKVKHDAEFRCKLCGSDKKLNTHHRDYNEYADIFGWSMNKLVCLCQNCHAKFHDKKTTLLK